MSFADPIILYPSIVVLTVVPLIIRSAVKNVSAGRHPWTSPHARATLETTLTTDEIKRVVVATLTSQRRLTEEPVLRDGAIEAQTLAKGQSWGERIRVTMAKAPAGHTAVTIASDPVFRGQFFECGVNRANVDLLTAALQRQSDGAPSDAPPV